MILRTEDGQTSSASNNNRADPSQDAVLARASSIVRLLRMNVFPGWSTGRSLQTHADSANDMQGLTSEVFFFSGVRLSSNQNPVTNRDLQ